MKNQFLWKRNAFVLFGFFLVSALMFGINSASAELVDESGIITLAVPSIDQVMPPTGEKLRREGADFQDVAVAKDGSFVVTWVFENDSASSTTKYASPVYARRFNADGTPLTEIIEVCDAIPAGTYIWNIRPRVACDDNGNFVVCWIKRKLNVLVDVEKNWYVDMNYIYARSFDADGHPRDNEFLISQEGIVDASSADVAMNGSGQFIVAWNAVHILRNEFKTLIYLKQFDTNGLLVNTDPIKVNPVFERINPLCEIISRPSVAIDADGGFAVSWLSRRWLYSFPMTIGQAFIANHMVRRFNQKGVPLGLAEKVSAISFFDGSSEHENKPSGVAPSIAMNDSGDYAVSHPRYEYEADTDWSLYYNDAGYRFFDKTGIAQGSDQEMNISIKDESHLLNVMDKDGNLVMGWIGSDISEAYDTYRGIYLMLVSKELPVSNGIVKVVENVTDDPSVEKQISCPALDASDDGRIVVVWHDNENLMGRIYTIR